MAMIVTDVITINHDLPRLVEQIAQAAWDDDNDMSVYDLASLSAYLKRQDTVFVVCYEMHGSQATLLGIASSRVELKPYHQEQWLYVDEVDVCADQRQKGAGKAIMQTLLSVARDTGCVELWLGTETDNVAANALYQAVGPSEVDTFIGYSYKIAD